MYLTRTFTRHFCLTLASSVLFALPAAAQVVTEDPEAEASPSNGQDGSLLSARVIRQIPISRLGFDQGVLLDGGDAEATLHFPLPRNLAIDQAGVALSFDYDRVSSEAATLRVDLDAIPQVAEELQGEGHLDLPVAVPPRALRQDQLSLGLSYRATTSADRCEDARILPDFLVVQPESSLHYAVDAHQVESLAGAWELLPQQVTISIGREPLSPEDFGALLEVSRKLLASGREIRYLRLPEIPEDAPVGQLASGLSGARALLFNGSSDEESFAIGHLVVASDGELAALERAVERAQLRFRRFSGADAGEIPEPKTELQPDRAQARPMRLVRFLDYPVIAAGGSNPEAGIALLASSLASVIGDTELDVASAQLSALAEKPDAVSFSELGFKASHQSANGSLRWSLTFGLSDFPEGRLPRAVELQLILPPSADGQQSDPLDVYFNDVLLATIPPGQGGTQRSETIALPAHLLTSRNTLLLELRRTAAPCDATAGRAPAELLGASLIHSSAAASPPNDFLELISHMGQDPLYLLPDTLRDRADEVMPLLANLSNAILSEATRPQLAFYQEQEGLPEVDRPFLLLGTPERTVPEAPLSLVEERLELRNSRGELILQAKGGEEAASLQLARFGEHSGLWLLPDGKGSYPSPASLLLDRSNLAWLDDEGVAASVQSLPQSRIARRFPWVQPWLDQLLQHKQAAMIGAGVVLALALMLLLTRARRRSRRKHAKNARTGLES